MLDKKYKCRYFTGIQTTKCELGIEYESVKDTTISPRKWPCIHPDAFTKCASFQTYTAEELAEQDRVRDEYIGHYIAAVAEIKKINGKDRGVYGKIDCPKCKGTNTLRYSISSYNGHIWGRCETEGCLSWVE